MAREHHRKSSTELESPRSPARWRNTSVRRWGMTLRRKVTGARFANAGVSRSSAARDVECKCIVQWSAKVGAVPILNPNWRVTPIFGRERLENPQISVHPFRPGKRRGPEAIIPRHGSVVGISHRLVQRPFPVARGVRLIRPRWQKYDSQDSAPCGRIQRPPGL